MFQNYLDRCRMKQEECQGESRVRENFLHGLVGELKLIPRRGFTLIELLVVIAIFAILITILLPRISRAKHKATNLICINNIRQQGVAILAYSVDNDQRYINLARTRHEGASYNNSIYLTNPLQRSAKETHAMMDYMNFNEYNRYSKRAAQIMSCPFAFDEYYNRAEPWRRDSDGDGQPEMERKFPLGSKFGPTSYKRYYTFHQPKWGVVKRPMIRVGDTIEYGNWANIASSAESRIIFSDSSGAYKKNRNLWIANHPIIPGSSNSYGSDGDTHIKNNFYWGASSTCGYVTTDHYSSNYLYDDLSVKVRNKLNESNTAASAIRIVTLPLDSFE